MAKKEKTKNIIQKLERPPIVVVMGHVDHGKTTLLDAIRKTDIAAREKGGITQKIGAYQVEVETKEGRKKITFIDTPGHEAFEKMRSRGASLTDLAVIVIDGVDGVMPQTKESIIHCQNAKVPFIVAVNKMDLPGFNIERVKKQLSRDAKVQVEGLGGDVVAIPISGKTQKGIDNLLEMIILLAQMSGVKGDPKGLLDGVIIESQMDKRKGPLGSAIIKNGTLRVGQEIFIDEMKVKVRALFNCLGESINLAGPGMPVEILGLETPPQVGSKITQIIPAEKEEVNGPATVLEMKLPEKRIEKLNIILKADAMGSLEAIEKNLPDDLEIIESGVGELNESDVLLAKSTKAIIIGFNVKIPQNVINLSENEKVLIKSYDLIYTLLEEVSEASMLIKEPINTEKVLGKAKIIAQFPGSKHVIIGCKVLEGRLARNDLVKIERKDKELGRAKISFMKHGKEDIQKAEVNVECGLLLEPGIDFAIDDMIISYRKL